jgi:ADP-heptose:LPS heptosyltransferase
MKRILLVRIGALGDAIHALPLVNELRAAFPEARIEWAAGPGVIRFLEGHPAVDRFVRVEKGLRGILAARREVRDGYEIAIDAQGLIKSAIIASAAAPRVIGRARGHARELPAAFLYTDQVVPGGRHVIEQNLDLLLPIAPERVRGEIRYDLVLPDPPAWPLLGESPVLFNIGGGWWTKLWPPERFAELAVRIEEELGAPVGIVWGPGEEDAARLIARRSPAIMAPPTTFRELGALFTKARLLVSGETGPLHLAVAVGCPTVALLGPTVAERNGPYGPGHAVIEPDLPCRPCHARSCADFICMPAIPVEKVFAAVADRLK